MRCVLCAVCCVLCGVRCALCAVYCVLCTACFVVGVVGCVLCGTACLYGYYSPSSFSPSVPLPPPPLGTAARAWCIPSWSSPPHRSSSVASSASWPPHRRWTRCARRIRRVRYTGERGERETHRDTQRHTETHRERGGDNVGTVHAPCSSSKVLQRYAACCQML